MEEIIKIIHELRGRDGCPWDQQQTHESLVPYLLEETWECIDEINLGNFKEQFKDELGDVLLQILMHAEIASENKNFDFHDIVDHLKKKVIRRHPHVFDKNWTKPKTAIFEEWDNIKRQEQGRTYHPLEKIPSSAPSFFISKKVQKYCKKNNIRSENTSLRDIFLTALQFCFSKKKGHVLGKIILKLYSVAEKYNYDLEKEQKKVLEQKIQQIIQSEQ